MIEVNKILYQPLLLIGDGNVYDISKITEDLTWEENDGELAQRASIKLLNQAYNGTWISALARVGAKLFIISDWGEGRQEIFRGTIWDYDYKSETNKNIDLTAMDNFIYLEQSEDYKWFGTGTSSRAMLQQIFSSWGIQTENLDVPSMSMPKTVFKSKNISDMVLEILDDVYKATGIKCFPRMVKGKVNIVRRGSNKDVYRFKVAENVESIEEQISLGNLVTRVKIIGQEDDDERTPVEAIVDGKTNFGILQKIVQRNQDDSLESAKASANSILAENGSPQNTRKLQSPDIPFLRKGDKIYIVAGSLNGYCYVKSVQHDAANKKMTIEVEG